MASEQTTPPSSAPKVSPVGGRLMQVEKVWQISGDFHRLPLPAESDLQSEFAIFQTGGAVTEDGGELVASVDLGFRLTATPDEEASVPGELLDKDTGRVVVAYVRSSYMITYTLDDGRDMAATDVDQFCATNAVHTAWPFWREFITTSLLRSGLESVPVPPFTVYGPLKTAVTYQRDEENPTG
jgi:hypothetical protein